MMEFLSYSQSLKERALELKARGDSYALNGQFDHAVGCYRKMDRKIAQADKFEQRYKNWPAFADNVINLLLAAMEANVCKSDDRSQPRYSR